MEKEIYDVLAKIEESNNQAYLVGGYPRDCYLGKNTYDYDICTSATPDVLKSIFSEIIEENIGSLKIRYHKLVVEVTTFRLEKYESTRTPIVSFTTSLQADLQRRDFIMNTLCMDKEGIYFDYFNAREDLDNKKIRAVGDPFIKMKEDPLRILRAIRFATTLYFEIEENLEKAIEENKFLVANLSYYRKKEELNKILLHDNCYYGIHLLQTYGLDVILECDFSGFIKVSNSEAIWAQISNCLKYPFSKKEKDKIEIIKELVSHGKIEDRDLYYYGLELSLLAAKIVGEDLTCLEDRYHNLPIHTRKDIVIDIEMVHSITSENISKIYQLLECEILKHHLKNDKKDIERFLMEYFV